MATARSGRFFPRSLPDTILYLSLTSPLLVLHLGSISRRLQVTTHTTICRRRTALSYTQDYHSQVCSTLHAPRPSSEVHIHILRSLRIHISTHAHIRGYNLTYDQPRVLDVAEWLNNLRYVSPIYSSCIRVLIFSQFTQTMVSPEERHRAAGQLLLHLSFKTFLITLALAESTFVLLLRPHAHGTLGVGSNTGSHRC